MHRWTFEKRLGPMAVISAVVCLICFGTHADADIRAESWSKKASSAGGAFQAYGVKSIGVLIAPVDGKPSFGHRYSERSVLSYDREFDTSAHRMSQAYELMLYDLVRQGLESRGYQVTLLNAGPWKDQRVRDLAAAASGIDAVMAIHYAARRSHTIFDVADDTWWSPFEGLKLTAYTGLFDVATGDLIYAQEAEELGTELLYEKRDVKIADVVFLGKASSNEYQASIYKTTVVDLSTGKRIVPVVRTPEGAIDISYVSTSAAEGFHMRQLYDKMRENLNPDEGDVKKSLLQRLLLHTEYRLAEEDLRRFERQSVRALGDAFAEAIPGRS